MNSTNKNILPANKSREKVKKNYNRISRVYDYFAGVFEKKYLDKGVELLDIKSDETVLEIGFGTGHGLKKMARSAGSETRIYGIDISEGMLDVSRKKLEKAGLDDKVELICGDVLAMSFQENKFDCVFMSFTLELFDTPEIPEVLDKIKEGLKPGGRLALISMSKENGNSLMLKIYEWLHKKFPRFADCRPIYAEQALRDAGLGIYCKEKVKLYGLPVEIIIGINYT